MEKVTGMFCHRRVSAKVKWKIYMTVVRSALLHAVGTTMVTKRQEAELQVVESKMLKFSAGETRRDMLRNEYIRQTLHYTFDSGVTKREK